MLVNMKQVLFCNLMICFLMFKEVRCYPVNKLDSREISSGKEEKLYPNGTVVGKYSYTDNEGNPVQLKYYADKAGYGVELKSIKIVDTDLNDATQTTIKALEDLSDFYNPSNTKYKISDPFELLNKDKNSNKKGYKSEPGYETYVQNEVQAPKKCGKEKIHVYFEKNREVRNADNDLEMFKYCNQMLNDD